MESIAGKILSIFPTFPEDYLKMFFDKNIFCALKNNNTNLTANGCMSVPAVIVIFVYRVFF